MMKTAIKTVSPPTGLDPTTRQRVEAAVLDLFSQREFHHVSLIEIARGANVSLQTLYKYYGSKERLLFTSLDTWFSKLAQRMLDHLQGIETFKDKLRKVFWVALDFFEKNPKVGQLLLSSVYINTWRQTETFRQTELMGVFMQVLHEGRDKGILTDEVDEKILLDFILGIAMRHMSMWIIRGQERPLTEKANILFEMLWRAISRPQ
jgi:AcrR family transcriptional regulator